MHSIVVLCFARLSFVLKRLRGKLFCSSRVRPVRLTQTETLSLSFYCFSETETSYSSPSLSLPLWIRDAKMARCKPQASHLMALQDASRKQHKPQASHNHNAAHYLSHDASHITFDGITRRKSQAAQTTSVTQSQCAHNHKQHKPQASHRQNVQRSHCGPENHTVEMRHALTAPMSSTATSHLSATPRQNISTNKTCNACSAKFTFPEHCQNTFP